ncbi:MAG: transglycosylase SLT domain-containing protein, partial [Brevundimonas sp.]
MSVGAIPSSGGVEAAIRRASSTTGVDFDFLMKTARRESAMNPSARAGTSSASGLFQFIEQTWLATVK